MKIGVVAREVSLSRADISMEGKRFLSVKVGLEEFAAMDLVGAGAGDTVLILTGKAACRLRPDCAVDAAVVGIVSLDKQAHCSYNEHNKRQ